MNQIDKEFYSKEPFFNNLSDRERSVLLSNASKVVFDQEEMFLKSGTLMFSVYYVHQGQIKIRDNDGRLIDLLGPGNFLGLSNLFNQDPIFFSAHGIKGTHLIQIEKSVLKVFISNNASFLKDVYNKSAENPSLLVRNLLTFKRQKINGALASFLIFFDEKNCLHSLTQKEISEILGYSRENVSKCMNDFQQEGYIELNEGDIKLKNKTALEKIQQFG